MELYRIKKKWLDHLMKYSAKCDGLDLRGEYTKETWNKKCFKDYVLERV